MLFCRLLNFFQNQHFRKILSGIQAKCQTDWIQIRPNIWIQSVCKSYEQTTLEVKELNVFGHISTRENSPLNISGHTVL